MGFQELAILASGNMSVRTRIARSRAQQISVLYVCCTFFFSLCKRYKLGDIDRVSANLSVQLLSMFDSENYTIPLNLTAAASSSRFFSPMPSVRLPLLVTQSSANVCISH